ncbi:MAG: hypothetical protein HUJ65_06115 [Oscillospiraceae bacterium]|nr:hypothetical protein [Oscillospiraceae bacterium]
MKKDNIRIVCITLTVLAIFILLLQMSVGGDRGAALSLGSVLNIVALAALAVYCILGGSKNLRALYIGAFGLKAIGYFIAVISCGLPGYESLGPLAWTLARCTLCFAGFMILLLAIDLGKVKSNIIAAVLIILPIVDIFVGVSALNQAGSTAQQLLYIVSIDLSDISVAGTICSAIALKYADKSERHSAKK